MALDVLIDFAYGMLIDGASEEEKQKIDTQLDTMAEQAASESKKIEKTLSDGRVVQISEARLARIRANAAASQTLQR